MEAIFEGIIALAVLMFELLVTVYLALLELVVNILVLLVGWISAPFWSKGGRQKEVPEGWKIALRRTASVILILGFIATLAWCWAAYVKTAPVPQPAPPLSRTLLEEAKEKAWGVLEKRIEEHQKAKQ
jgi:hypothetical protein